MEDHHVVDINKLNTIANSLQTQDTDACIVACENTKRSIDLVIKLMNLENKRRSLDKVLNDTTRAREKKTVITDKTRIIRRELLNPYDLRTLRDNSKERDLLKK